MKLLPFLLAASLLLAQQAKEEMPVFRAGVSLVRVDVQVSLPGGRNVSGLRRGDFQVFDEGQPRKIEYFDKEALPLDLLLLLDVSGSMRRSLEELAAATRTALVHLHQGDRVAVMLFARRSQLALEFTDDFGAVQKRIIDSIYKDQLGNGTLINEALLAAAEYSKAQPMGRRRAILIVTDNEGEHYTASNGDVVRSLYGAEAVLSAIVVSGGKPHPPERYRNPDQAPPDVFDATVRTGGRAITADKAGEAFAQLVEEIRAGYLIQYVPPAAPPGTFRKVRVELTPAARRKHPDAGVRAREGYWTAPEAEQ